MQSVPTRYSKNSAGTRWDGELNRRATLLSYLPRDLIAEDSRELHHGSEGNVALERALLRRTGRPRAHFLDRRLETSEEVSLDLSC